MNLFGSADLVMLETINRLIAGARITRVLLGFPHGEPLLVIETDRVLPDSGQRLVLRISDAAHISVATCVLHLVSAPHTPTSERSPNAG